VKNVPPEAAEAVERYRAFHRLEPTRIGEFDAGFQIPERMMYVGPALWETYRSSKVDPATLRRPRKPIDYIHEHSQGVGAYLPVAGRADSVAVPGRFRDAAALTKLGLCTGFAFDDGGEQEVVGRAPLPELYATPDGRCLLVIQSKKKVLAMMWGGGLGVYPRGIDG
jgi:hypothetical protein